VRALAITPRKQPRLQVVTFASFDELEVYRPGETRALVAHRDTLGWVRFRRGDLVSAERYVRAPATSAPRRAAAPTSAGRGLKADK
jgi:hypothetical protein